MSKCEICWEHLSKYKCPGCLLKTCSLPCVKRHKAESKCDGKRDKTAFIRIKDFNNMNLFSDYRLLEESQRRADSTYRDQLKRRNNKPNFLITLVKEAKIRGINLKTMPYPMDKRKNNFTSYQYKSRTIFWQVEWVFPQSNVKYIGKRISEHSLMSELLKEYIHPTDSDPIKRQALKQYCREGLESCRLFMKVEDRPANDKRYHELSLTKTLQQNLVGKCVMEYPIIHVVLARYCSCYKLQDTDCNTDTAVDCVGEAVMDTMNADIMKNVHEDDHALVMMTNSVVDSTSDNIQHASEHDLAHSPVGVK